MKKRIIFIFLLVTMVGVFMFSGKNVYAYEQSNDYLCQNMLNFVSEHINQFKEEYNKKIDSLEEKMTSHFIEGYTLVKVLDVNEYGIYIDFDGDNGYMLTTFRFEIYDLEVSGDLPYLKDVKFAYFHSADGYLYFDGTTYQKYKLPDSTFSTEEVRYDAAGQSGDGEGYIYDPAAYVAERHPEYQLSFYYRGIEHSNYVNFGQTNVSYYAHHFTDFSGKVISHSTESNCAPVAIFNMMNSWKGENCVTTLPTHREVVNVFETITSQKFYNDYGHGSPNFFKRDYWTISSENVLEDIPVLYAQIYETVSNHTGYRPDRGLTYDEIADVTTRVAAHYGKTLNLHKTDSFASLICHINNNCACLMGITNGITYSNHAVALIGYARYEYTTDVYAFREVNVAYLYQIGDGQSILPTFYDPNYGNAQLRFIGSGLYQIY